MDNFIDKLAQKFSAQDMIRANLAAEAKETKKLREKMESYESLLQEMRQINLKNMESAERINQMLAEGAGTDKEYLKEMFEKANENLHTENVKVYRNVQAAVKDELGEQTRVLLEEQSKQIKEQQEHIENQHKLIEQQGIRAKKSRCFLQIMSVLIFLGVAAQVVLQVMHMMNFKFW